MIRRRRGRRNYAPHERSLVRRVVSHGPDNHAATGAAHLRTIGRGGLARRPERLGRRGRRAYLLIESLVSPFAVES